MKNEIVSGGRRRTAGPSQLQTPESGAHGRWLLGASGLLLLVVGLLRTSLHNESTPAGAAASTGGTLANCADPSTTVGRERLVALGKNTSQAPRRTPEEIVAAKVSQFGRSRRDVLYTMARQLEVGVPDEIARFFDAVEGGRWEEIDAQFQSLLQRKRAEQGSGEIGRLWGPILDAYGTAEQAHLWPAQKLLDYGNAVLDSLRPGMIYVGGTDEGRWIPTLLNETSEGERHVILTQNALADQSYLKYLEFLHGDQITALNQKDSERAFADYLSDAKRRLEHDQQFPDEPKQIRPGEDVRFVDNKVQVSGQIAVMDINERLLGALMEKNPDRPFALQQSYPFKSTYAEAVPLGPIMELRASEPQNAYTAERAAHTVDYWRTTAQRLLSEPSAQNSPDTLASFALLAVAQGNLLAEHQRGAEAEETYRVAATLAPSYPEAVLTYANLLVDQQRPGEAIPILETALAAAPDNRQFHQLLAGIKNQNRN